MAVGPVDTPPRQEETASYAIASASEADLDTVMEIERLSFATPWVRQAFAEEIDRPWAHLELLHDRRRGRAVGFCNYWLVSDELHILNVAVHPDFRKQGCASLLVQRILEVARRHKTRVVSLEVRASNHAARSLYRKFGFCEVGTRPKYYADDSEDAVLMDLSLQDGNPERVTVPSVDGTQANGPGAKPAGSPRE
jgi:ribosomal-protein-alanine N-acetyltransferase